MVVLCLAQLLARSDYFVKILHEFEKGCVLSITHRLCRAYKISLILYLEIKLVSVPTATTNEPQVFGCVLKLRLKPSANLTTNHLALRVASNPTFLYLIF